MQKFKSINWSVLISLIKCCLVGIVSTLIGVVVFAVVLKFANVPSIAISYINDIIKVVSIFIMVICIKKRDNNNLLLKSIVSGVIYAFLTFIIFSILNGGFVLNLSFVYDLLFVVITSAIAAIMLNLISKKTV